MFYLHPDVPEESFVSKAREPDEPDLGKTSRGRARTLNRRGRLSLYLSGKYMHHHHLS